MNEESVFLPFLFALASGFATVKLDRLESVKLGHMTPAFHRSLGEAQSSFFQNGSGRKTTAAGWAIAYTDGGSRGNPGPSGYGVVILGEDGSILGELSEFLGMRTNNVAEYSGLLAALEFALANGHPRLRVVSDSELMVKQIRGQYRVQSPDLRPLYEEAKRRIAKLEAFQIEHVLRGKNKKADELANQAMDRGMLRKSELKAGVSASSNAASTVAAPPVRPLRGIVKEGRINLLEGSIPEGTIVVVMPEKALGQRAGKP
ncbi:MAG: ribonuclease HI family protein [Acidobacteriaceae bacterium]